METRSYTPKGAAEVRSPSSYIVESITPPGPKLPDNWGDLVVNWKPGRKVPVGTILKEGSLFAKDVQPPSPIEVTPIKPAAVEEVNNAENVATLPDTLPPGAINLYIDFAAGKAPNPNLQEEPLKDLVAKREANAEKGSLLGRMRNALTQRMPRSSYSTGD